MKGRRIKGRETQRDMYEGRQKRRIKTQRLEEEDNVGIKGGGREIEEQEKNRREGRRRKKKWK
jgi:hypothetical protein